MVEGYFLFVDLCCGLEKGRLVVGEVKFSGLKHARHGSSWPAGCPWA